MQKIIETDNKAGRDKLTMKLSDEQMVSQLDILLDLGNLIYKRLLSRIDKDIQKDRDFLDYIKQRYVKNNDGLFEIANQQSLYDYETQRRRLTIWKTRVCGMLSGRKRKQS